jgi:hypothetical protein
VVLWPKLHLQDPEAIWQLPAEERSKVLGDMVLLPCQMTAPEWREIDSVKLPAVLKVTCTELSESDEEQPAPPQPEGYQPNPVLFWPHTNGRPHLRFVLEGDAYMPDARFMPSRLNFSQHWLNQVGRDALEYATSAYPLAREWFVGLEAHAQLQHVSCFPALTNELDLWDFDGQQLAADSWRPLSVRQTHPGDITGRTEIPNEQGGHRFYLYAEVLQAHQLRVIVAYLQKDRPQFRANGRNFHSVPPYGPHLQLAFRKENSRHARGVRPDAVPREPAQFGDYRAGWDEPVRCEFLTEHQGGWPDISDLPWHLDMRSSAEAWSACVANTPQLQSELRDLYEVGRRLIDQHGQPLYEHYGALCIPGATAETWTYRSLAGMRPQTHTTREDVDRSVDSLAAQNPRYCRVDAAIRAQLLVIRVATERFGMGPHRNNLPPPWGNMVLEPCWTRLHEPAARADWPTLMQQDF